MQRAQLAEAVFLVKRVHMAEPRHDGNMWKSAEEASILFLSNSRNELHIAGTGACSDDASSSLGPPI